MALPANCKQIAANNPNFNNAISSGNQRLRAAGNIGSSDRGGKDIVPIFTHSNHGNPAFTPLKVGKSNSKIQSDSRTPKPPKPPERPILPYMRFSKKVWDSVKTSFPDLKLWELGKKIGSMWKTLSENEKQVYLDEYDTDKVEYEKALRTYHNSPAYLAYLSAKSKVKSAIVDGDVHDTPSRSTGKGQQERRIDIQPAEDDEDQDDGYSFKHIAYARFLRNHRLINEIFSDAVVPDVRSVVTTQRMQTLKKQVSSLTMHQTKLEAELQQMEEKFETKKQKMTESSERFREELKKHCKPAVDDETFQKMFQKMYEEMRKERQKLYEEAPLMCNVLSQNSGVNDESKLQQTNMQPDSNKCEVIKTSPESVDLESDLKSNIPQKKCEKSKISSSENVKTTKILQETKDLLKENVDHIQSTFDKLTSKNVQQQIHMSPLSAKGTPNLKAGLSVATNLDPNAVLPATSQQIGPTHHVQQPPPHHLQPHLVSHQSVSSMPHAYTNFSSQAGATRSPYYQSQFTGHPSQTYGQYSPYSYHQQFPPPGPHFMPPRPPMQYQMEQSSGAGQQTGHVPHDLYGQSQIGHLGPPQQAGSLGSDSLKRDAQCAEQDKKDQE